MEEVPKSFITFYHYQFLRFTSILIAYSVTTWLLLLLGVNHPDIELLIADTHKGALLNQCTFKLCLESNNVSL